MTVLVHPEPVELESHELVSPRHLHNTDYMAVTREPREQEMATACLPARLTIFNSGGYRI
jgi:hypothetical protein